jgi:hypothetical protein
VNNGHEISDSLKQKMFELHAAGKCGKQIAAELGLNSHTVCGYIYQGVRGNTLPKKKVEPSSKLAKDIVSVAACARLAGMTYGRYVARMEGINGN